MASAKIATLVIRTLAKPISLRIKEQARQHERFRRVCMSLAQFMYRTEIKMRTNILGENVASKHIRPLSEAKAIENGANLLAEGFLFSVAAALIIGESWRSSRKEGKRREGVDEQLEELKEKVEKLETLLEEVREDGRVGRGRTDELTRIVERVVEIGLRGEADLHLPPSKATTQINSSSPLSEDGSTSSPARSGVLGALPRLSERFSTQNGRPSVEKRAEEVGD